ncbi:putative cyclin-D6-1 [Morella rubra]|uniref:B-like cyclin n=1 Tax=Morella rubra TaxID=262757 RepID=A0A6A1WYU3_9ROSI|nr:putative cyclin-D6-1 [Morella rubra]
MEFELEDPLTSFQEYQSDTIGDLFASESDHMLSQSLLSSLKTSDFNVSFRFEAISYMSQLSGNLDPFIPYLAVNYMDRFISKKEMPRGKPWVLRLLVLSCLSIAAKMKNTPFSPSDFLVIRFPCPLNFVAPNCKREEGCIFDSLAINKMELLILNALGWRMRPVTPFPFLYFFLSFIQLKDPPMIHVLKCRASDIIFNATNEIKLLEYKPSILAASALLSASYELFQLQFPSFKVSILSCKYVNKENLLKCFNALREMVVTVEGYESMLDTVSSTRTPLSVLDRRCTQWKCNNTSTDTTTEPEKRDVKRRKLNGESFQIKQN